jgi:DNA primase large subunit
MRTEYTQITKKELSELIEEIVEQKLQEWIDEIDDDSKIRDEVCNRLLQQKNLTASGERGRPLTEIMQQFWLDK